MLDLMYIIRTITLANRIHVIKKLLTRTYEHSIRSYNEFITNICIDNYAIEAPPGDILFMPPTPSPTTVQTLLLPDRDISIDSDAVKQSMSLE